MDLLKDEEINSIEGRTVGHFHLAACAVHKFGYKIVVKFPESVSSLPFLMQSRT